MLYTNRTLRKNIHQSFFGLFQFHLIFLVFQMYFAKHFRQRVDLQQEALTIKIIRPFHHVTNMGNIEKTKILHSRDLWQQNLTRW